MASALIHYFSGTGNTARVVRLVAGGLERGGYRVDILNIEEGKHGNGVYDLHIFAFPVYAMAAPAVMLRYIRQCGPGNGAKAGVIAVWGELDTSGKVPGWEGQALEHVKRMLRRRGYAPCFTDGVGYPESFAAVFTAPPVEAQVKIVTRGEARVEEMVGRLIAQTGSFRRCTLPNQIWSRLVFYLYTIFGRRVMGKIYVADHRCNGCGKCVRACPVKSIRMVGRQPRWNFACEGCQRCINLCPESAIQSSMIRALSSVVVLFFPYGRWLGSAVAIPDLGPIGNPLFHLAAWICGSVLAFLLLDQFFFLAGRIPVIRKVLSLAHNRKYLRYLEPHFKPCLRPPDAKAEKGTLTKTARG